MNAKRMEGAFVSFGNCIMLLVRQLVGKWDPNASGGAREVVSWTTRETDTYTAQLASSGRCTAAWRPELRSRM